jgi:hypothetical protein
VVQDVTPRRSTRANAPEGPTEETEHRERRFGAILAALAGTLADAKLDGSALAVVLVMEYKTDCTVDSNHDANARNFEQFLGRLIGSDVERSVSPDGWVTKPRPILGDGTWMPPRTDVSFAKLTRDRRHQLSAA